MGILSLLVGALGGPVIALAVLHGLYPLSAMLCGRGGELTFHLGSVAALLLVAGCGWLAWRDWRLAGGEWPGDEGGVLGRSRFLAAMGMLSSGIFALIVLAQWLPLLFHGPCAGKGT